MLCPQIVKRRIAPNFEISVKNDAAIAHDQLDAAFIGAQRSFYMATVSETGWPYVQHRGGAPGFLQVVDAKTLSFVDVPGNRQFISSGNLLDIKLEGPQIAVRPYTHTDHYWQVYFDTHKAVVATFGTAQDVTADELRIETLFPADPATGAGDDRDPTVECGHHARAPASSPASSTRIQTSAAPPSHGTTAPVPHSFSWLKYARCG